MPAAIPIDNTWGILSLSLPLLHTHSSSLPRGRPHRCLSGNIVSSLSPSAIIVLNKNSQPVCLLPFPQSSLVTTSSKLWHSYNAGTFTLLVLGHNHSCHLADLCILPALPQRPSRAQRTRRHYMVGTVSHSFILFASHPRSGYWIPCTPFSSRTWCTPTSSQTLATTLPSLAISGHST